ncbi:hypothetical protein BJX64DRAFT_283029 [Aspergillus heterothallicus]
MTNPPATENSPWPETEHHGIYIPPNAEPGEFYIGHGSVIESGINARGQLYVRVVPTQNKGEQQLELEVDDASGFTNHWGRPMPRKYLSNTTDKGPRHPLTVQEDVKPGDEAKNQCAATILNPVKGMSPGHAFLEIGSQSRGAYFAPDGNWYYGVGNVVAVGQPATSPGSPGYVLVDPAGKGDQFFHPITGEGMPSFAPSLSPTAEERWPARAYYTKGLSELVSGLSEPRNLGMESAEEEDGIPKRRPRNVLYQRRLALWLMGCEDTNEDEEKDEDECYGWEESSSEEWGTMYESDSDITCEMRSGYTGRHDKAGP